jgi:hypothetical protein
MIGTFVYYLTYPFVAPFVALIALLDVPYTGWHGFKKNYINIYGGIYVKGNT